MTSVFSDSFKKRPVEESNLQTNAAGASSGVLVSSPDGLSKLPKAVLGRAAVVHGARESVTKRDVSKR